METFNTITFLLPAFKAKYLAEMLESIKNQTYTDFKVLISDDCSPEPIREVCEPYLADPRFIYRRNEENMGSKSLVAHWNLLVDLCDTEYLVMSSDDDVYSPTFLEEMIRLLKKYPKVDLLRARVQTIDTDGKRTNVDSPTDEYESQKEYLYNTVTTIRLQCIANFVCRTSSLKQIGGYQDFPLAMASDVAMMLSLCVNGVANSRAVLFSFRCSGENISIKSNSEIDRKKLQACNAFIPWFLNYIDRYADTSNKLDKRDWLRIKYAFLERRAQQMLTYVAVLSLAEMLDEYRYMRQYGLLPGRLSFYRFLKVYFLK